VRTFFGGSQAEAASALFDLPDQKLSRDELARLARMVKQAKAQQAMKEGR
jgi:hypothetical protein